MPVRCNGPKRNLTQPDDKLSCLPLTMYDIQIPQVSDELMRTLMSSFPLKI
jgi:hypothetical protein